MPKLKKLIESGIINGFVDHAEERAKERGFDDDSIAKIITEGQQKKVEFEKYKTEQSQYHYTLQGNTVVVNTSRNKNYLKIITVYSNDTINNGKFIPFEEIE